ncbi:methyltransferase domain-containing protein [Gemella sp. 19428wG2_WT2a]|nr:methyltransferase domain-containing protein [Gemella sp. 19428wG2_WT2a]TFU58551.1 methyltransferase domain-containing protein [Gemella sp. WT2a]
MKIENVIKKFNKELDYSCPKCKNLAKINNISLKCINNHSYDFSKKGYIHLINNYKDSKYDEKLFKARNYVFSNGFYKQLLEEIKKFINERKSEIIVDLGCGEGYYIKELKEKYPETYFYGLDNAKSAIEYAVKYDKKNPYILANLANIPFSDKTVDLILNILSPANYEEFVRILKDDGLVLKIIPSSNYLKEIRNLLEIDDYSNQETIDQLSKFADIVKRNLIGKTYTLSKEDAENFLKMTPLSFSKEISEKHIENLKEITVELEMLILKLKK